MGPKMSSRVLFKVLQSFVRGVLDRDERYPLSGFGSISSIDKSENSEFKTELSNNSFINYQNSTPSFGSSGKFNKLVDFLLLWLL